MQKGLHGQEAGIQKKEYLSYWVTKVYHVVIK